MNSDDMTSLENLCDSLYNATDEQSRRQAGAALDSVLDNPENFRALLSIFTASTHAQLVYLALSSLSKSLSLHWKRLSEEEKGVLYSTLLTLLLDGREKPVFVYGGLSKCLARTCRLA